MNEKLMIKMVLESWNSTIRRTDSFLDSVSDEELMNEVSPNRNRGVYLLGHLVAVHDLMLPLLDFGNQLFPNLTETFLKLPDNKSDQNFNIKELRQSWKTVNEALSNKFKNMSMEDWLKKHTAVSAEDFVNEPHRNKLNVLLSRTNHLSFHLGQMICLKIKIV